MSEYLTVKKTQINMFKSVPLYHKAKDESYLLYKKSGDVLDNARLEETKYPELYIHKDDKEKAVKELFKSFNKTLAVQCLSKELTNVRATLSLIVQEAFEDRERQSLDCLPDTIEVLLNEYTQNSEVLGVLVNIKNTSNIVIGHTVNVLLLTLRYCLFHGIGEEHTRHLAFCALVHDIGISLIDPVLVETDRKLSDDEFGQYQQHTVKGHDLLIKQGRRIKKAALVAMDHHERIDGSGYPNKKSDISMESQLIALIDCYEPLTYRDKAYRQAKEPYASLSIIKEEVMRGKFSKALFKELCSSLGEKN